MNIVPVSGRALASSDMYSTSLYTSPYWLYKCFINQLIQIFNMKFFFIKNKSFQNS